METKVQVTMTVEQARVMMRAIDFYMRILMGQFEEIEHLFFAEENDPVFERKRDCLKYNDLTLELCNCSHFDVDNAEQKINYQENSDLDRLLGQLKRLVYPTLSRGAYWGITGSPCPERATMMYDMYKSLDHAISWHQHPEGGWTVNFDKPMHWYKKLPLPEVKVFEE